MTLDDLVQTIHAARARLIAGDNDAAADLYAYRLRLLKMIHRQPHRVCVVCGAPKLLTAFRERPGHGRRRTCDACINRLDQQRYAAARRAARQRFAERNPEYDYERNKARYWSNPGAAKAAVKAWRAQRRKLAATE